MVPPSTNDKAPRPLEISDQAKRRILVGLSWNPKEVSKTELLRNQIMDSISLAVTKTRFSEKNDGPGREEDYKHFDLDLYCYAYDQDGNFQTVVDPSAWNAIDESGKIYHSGDDMHGTGGPDDEQIYIELKDIPEKYSRFFFVVKSDSMHALDETDSPEIRLTDSLTNNDFLKLRIDQLPDSNAFAYVFCTIFWNDGKWFYKEISAFSEFEQDWQNYLKTFL